MIHRVSHHINRLHHHILPHRHNDGEQHHAHIIGNRALFVYFQLFVFVFISIQVIKTHAPQILGAVTFSADQIISLTNAKRAQNGLGAVSFNQQLALAASAKANDMLLDNYWAHVSPSGKTPWSFINAAGYKYVYAGENLARDFNDASAVVDAWMNSPSHRSNLLDKNFKEIGVAVVSGKLTGQEGILVVQMFGSGVSSIPNAVAAVPKSTPSPVPSPTVTTIAQASPVVVATTPLPSPVPTPSVLPSASPIVAIAGPQTTIEPLIDTQVLASREFSITKAISLGLVGFIFALFALETVYVIRKEHLKLRSGVLAHLGILAFLLLLIWYAVGGAIL